MIPPDLDPPSLLRSGAAGIAAGATSALANVCWFVAATRGAGFEAHVPTVGSIVLSSVVPTVLAAIGYFVLARITRHATRIFAVVTLGVTIASFESIFSDRLPGGEPKPRRFDAIVMPMHAMVGLTALVLVPRLAGRRPRRTIA